MEKLINETREQPREKLRYIYNTLELLGTTKDPLGNEQSWRKLYKDVRPYHTGLECTTNVRDAVYNFIVQKIPHLQEQVHSIRDLPERALVDAIVHNWFEALGEEVSGQRKEILLTVMAHVVKRIETRTYRDVLQNASDSDLAHLGLTVGTRDLLIDVMEAAVKTDTIFIRFLAYIQNELSPPKEASGVKFFVRDSAPMTIAALFPHEAQFLANHFEKIAHNNSLWKNEPGADAFESFCKILAAFYREGDPTLSEKLQREVEEKYQNLLRSPFPIIMTPAMEGYRKEPYFDPELKISLATPDARAEEQKTHNTRRATAESLETLNASQFIKNVQENPIRVAMVVGCYGCNLTFNAVAQEKPSIILYLNEQIRAYDAEFPSFLQSHVVTENIFPRNSEEARKRMEYISRFDTILHELAHGIYPDGDPESQRLGRRPLTIIDEVKAEITHRAMVPTIIERMGLDGTKDEWAVGMLGSLLQVLKDQPPEDPYYYASAYCLNECIAMGAVRSTKGRLEIRDVDTYYRIFQKAAEEILALYRDPQMTEKKASRWIKTRCAPNHAVALLAETLKKENN